jgi:dihydroxyacid dehydratase/phosphogluconate dehydratase
MQAKLFNEGPLKGKTFVTSDIKEAIGKYLNGELTPENLNLIETQTCCSPGACNMMGTANTMACIVEAMGLSLPGCATLSAIGIERDNLARDTGKIILDLVKNSQLKMPLKLLYHLVALPTWFYICVLCHTRLGTL